MHFGNREKIREYFRKDILSYFEYPMRPTSIKFLLLSRNFYQVSDHKGQKRKSLKLEENAFSEIFWNRDLPNTCTPNPEHLRP
jgi:hypothetical protein